MNVTGRPETRNGDVSSDRGFATEYVNVGGGAKPGAIPNFSRILSARSGQSSIQRQELQTKLKQKDHANLLDKDIKRLAEEWEGDPHDPEFWQKFEGETS